MRKFALLLIAILLVPLCLTTVSCKKDKTLTLNVYNWEEYIAEDDYDLISEFEKYYKQTYGVKVKVNYSTFGTNENMYNELKLTQNKDKGTYDYDLVCPSDYMIQRMIEEDMLEKYDYNNGYTYIENYNEYTSPYIKKLFTDNNWQEYATCYMWGTMGYTYNPEKVKMEDMQTWKGILKPEYKYKSTIKDSPRDSYVLAMGIAYENELNALDRTASDYNSNLVNLFNTVNKESIDRVDGVLRDIKKNIYGFEVDSGKNDMASGKLWINFAWSGDAVYVLDVAEEAGTELYYTVPDEGSNIFFDGWVMPKGANKELAQEFLNFLYRPESAVENMNYIGYTPATAGDEMFENAIDWYGLYTLIESDESDESVYIDGKHYEEYYFGDLDDSQLSTISNGDGTYNILYPIYDEAEENIIGFEEDTVEVFARDVDYFFSNISDEYKTDGKAIIYIDSEYRQFDTQYPSEEIVNRCAVMKHLPTEQNKMLNDMWASVKIGYMKPLYMILILVAIALVLVFVIVFFKLIESGKFGYGKTRKNMKLISRIEKK